MLNLSYATSPTALALCTHQNIFVEAREFEDGFNNPVFIFESFKILRETIYILLIGTN